MKYDTEQGVLNAYNKVTSANNPFRLVEYNFLVLYREIAGYWK